MPRHGHLAAARALAALRVALGVVLLLSTVGKFTIHKFGGWLPLPVVTAEFQRELPNRLGVWWQKHPDGMAGAVVRDLLIPNGPLVAGGVGWLQVFAGLGLVLGLYTTIASLAAVLVALALAIAAAARSEPDARGYLLMVWLALAFIGGRAGVVWGLDGWRHERRRHREL
jgi:uncharacterized membrane protein YphA (DoxX/SURF4 family)